MSRNEYQYPLRLKAGDTIGIIAPSSPFDIDRFRKGVGVLESLGFNVWVPEEIFRKEGFLAGTDDQRSALIHQMFNMDEIKAIMCARGGYGSMRLLPLIDYKNFINNPKLLMGFSDISALLTVISQQCRVVCWHGPVLTSLAEAGSDTITSLRHSLTSTGPTVMHADQGVIIYPGKAKGLSAGGNLSVLCHLAGTPYAPDLSGRILMLEDVGEAPYRIDRMLTQMKLSGFFEGVAGVVAGSFDRCGDSYKTIEIFNDIFSEYGIPVLYGFPFGHIEPNLSFPIGVEATMDSDSMCVEFR